MDLKTVSKLINVSPSTISRVLNNHPSQRISDDKRAYILKSVKKYGYTPSSAARSLVLQKNFSVSLVMHAGSNIPGMINTGLGMLMESIMALQSNLNDKHYELRLDFISRDQPELTFSKLFETKRKFDGIVFPRSIATKVIVDFVLDKKIPCAVFDDPQAKEWPVNYFENDAAKDIEMVVDHLTEIGHEKIALIGWDMKGRKERKYEEYIKEKNLIHDSGCIITADVKKDKYLAHRDHGRKSFEKLLENKELPTAVICSTDLIAFGAMDIMHEKGIQFGTDMAIVGNGDLESLGFCPFGESVLTTLHLPHREIGMAIAEVLTSQVDNKSIPIQRKAFTSKLIIRKSSGQ